MPLIRIHDLDDRQRITTPIEINGTIDYWSDIDKISIDLARGESINVTVESIDFTPSLTVGFVGASGGQLVYAYPTQATGLAHANQLKYLAQLGC
ncbi:MAG: hypothetical protein QF878_05240 [SAR202 cluster bacterium]|nr:hypothetical protein [SAR202 cluster bacterium]